MAWKMEVDGGGEVGMVEENGGGGGGVGDGGGE